MPHWLYAWAQHWPLHSPRFWIDVAFVLALVLLASRLTRYKWLFIVFVLPGTIAHELAHWLVALLLGGDPSAPSLWPRTEGQRWTLGHVTIRKPRWYNTLPIALAPLLLLPLAALSYRHWLRYYPLDHWQHWLGLYIVATLLRSALPSVEDWRLLRRYQRPLLIVALLTTAVFIALRWF